MNECLKQLMMALLRAYRFSPIIPDLGFQVGSVSSHMSSLDMYSSQTCPLLRRVFLSDMSSQMCLPLRPVFLSDMSSLDMSSSQMCPPLRPVFSEVSSQTCPLLRLMEGLGTGG